MTIQQKATNYVEEELNKRDDSPYSMHVKKKLFQFDGFDIEEAYAEGANFVIEELETMLQELKEKNQTLWTRSSLEDKLKELKGE